MYEYKVRLPYRVRNCIDCPFRRTEFMHENVNSDNKLTGVVDITRNHTLCALTLKPIMFPIEVDGYNRECPLQGNIVEIPDKPIEVSDEPADEPRGGLRRK
jgi:hypothetical protein